MDRSNYKRLGDYIRSVDVRNRDLAVTNLLGVSISKTFIPSIANTIGTDMSTYKVVEPYQFAYGPVTSRNGDKITFALYKGEEKCIISQAYETFEIIDKNLLDPDYLMMWALRPEFDRYARFKSNGSAREIFSWGEMCEVYLPVPDIATQRKIVAEYQAVENRIATNKRLIAKLEEAAQAIYKKMFVDDIDPEHLPDGWRNGTLDDLGDIISGATPSTEVSEYWTDNGIVWLSPADLSRDKTLFMRKGAKCITPEGYKSASTKMLPVGTILFSSRAPIGLMSITAVELCTNQGFKSILPKEEIGTEYSYYVLYSLKERIANENTGATFAEVSGSSLKQYKVILPCKEITSLFTDRIKPLHMHIDNLECENSLLKDMQSILLLKLPNNYAHLR